MVQDDSSATATKQDVQGVKEDVQAIKQDIHVVLHEIRKVKTLMLAQDEFLQEQINGLPTKEDMHTAIQLSEQHMLAAMEDMRYDMVGIHKDKIDQHEDRIVALETITGLRR